jgi:hypothetical protein
MKNKIILFDLNYSFSRYSIPSIFSAFYIVISENDIKPIANNSIIIFNNSANFIKYHYLKIEIAAIKTVIMMFEIKIFMSN